LDERNDESLIKKLIGSFEDAPFVSSLGTLSSIDTEAVSALVKMGKKVVPELLVAIQAENPRTVIYAVYCLGQLGDTSVLPQLKQVEKSYLAKAPKGEFDFSVAIAAKHAIERLSENLD
jgi:HEAT repeat protein